MTESSELLRPRPRRPFELSPPSNDSSQPSTPSVPSTEPTNNAELLDIKGDFGASRTGSVMNLTSSTLFGIYSPTAFEGPRDESTAWGTETPPIPRLREDLRAAGIQATSDQHPRERKVLVRRPHSLGRLFFLSLLKSVLLFVFGVTYGTIMAHLHENHWITPVKMEVIDGDSPRYLGLWGIGGVALGSVLPWLDSWWEGSDHASKQSSRGPQGHQHGDPRSSSRWSSSVRSIGAFVGIAFAMRRLPWESTAQASLTLALVNPFLWYLIDRTKTGFWLSAGVGLGGMGIILGLHPEIVPPAAGVFSQGPIAVGTWLASVLFSACVCFGNIGRQLALGNDGCNHPPTK
ncbi:Insulin-induced protein (INSIG) domain containing protein [Elaphomyces granulatus]